MIGFSVLASVQYVRVDKEDELPEALSKTIKASVHIAIKKTGSTGKPMQTRFPACYACKEHDMESHKEQMKEHYRTREKE